MCAESHEPKFSALPVAVLACAMWATLIAGGCMLPSGCMVSKSRLTASETHNGTLAEQNRAQLTEIENLKQHSRTMEQQLVEAEKSLAQLGRGRRGKGSVSLPPALRGRLIELSERYPGVDFDAETGISKFDTDVLFDSANATLRGEARDLLDEFATIFSMADAAELKVMIVGHADDRAIAKRPTREQFPNNWHLSTSRALAVADYLRAAGMPEDRLGVAGFGSQQPVIIDQTADARQRNRRVEMFIMGPDTPVVGWNETPQRLY